VKGRGPAHRTGDADQAQDACEPISVAPMMYHSQVRLLFRVHASLDARPILSLPRVDVALNVASATFSFAVVVREEPQIYMVIVAWWRIRVGERSRLHSAERRTTAQNATDVARLFDPGRCRHSLFRGGDLCFSPFFGRQLKGRLAVRGREDLGFGVWCPARRVV
jgi:hypothetical protein